jgi:HD-like signal output (HDOD) protein
MRRILFVDDEQAVLDGLRDQLRKQRKQWEMVFVLGGPAAMAELENNAFDVVVSDMRMPVIDGATLLHHVKERYPAAARIILSGQADRQSVERALPAAHQFLSKPCDADTLRIVVTRACQLQKTLSDSGIRCIIGKLDKLPSTPQTYWELTNAAARPESGVAEFAAIVERDPAMSVKVLQLVNSAYFGLPQRVTSAQQAVARLGVELLKALALSVHAFGTMPAPPVKGFSLEQLQQHSLLTARLGRQLVGGDAKRAGEVFSAAVVHDIGKLILAVGMPERFAEVLREYAATTRPLHVLESELLQVTHAEVGGYLLGFWGLPLSIVEAVAFHHAPSQVADGDLGTLAAVHVADALLEEQQNERIDPQREGKLDTAFVERAGLTAKLEEWRLLARAISS